MILGINTAGECELALVEKGQVLFEEVLREKARESEYLLPKIREVLLGLERDFSEISRILVINGPGAYTSLRVGISIANALAYGLQCELFEMSAFELFWLKDEARTYKYAVFSAGLKELFVQKRGAKKVEIKGREEFLKKNREDFFLIGGEEKSELLSLGEVLCGLDFDKMSACTMAMPNYLRGANVTKSKKPLSLC